MAYILFIPLSVYLVLVAVIAYRYPRTPGSVAMALYAGFAALVTAGYIILGTSAERAPVEGAAIGVVLLSGWVHMILWPLAVLGLFFDHWLRLHRREVIWASLGMAVGVGLVAVFLLLAYDYEGVLPVNRHAWMHWILAYYGYSWPENAIILLGSQVAYVGVLVLALAHRRVALWREAVPMTLVGVGSVLVPLLAPLAGANALVTVTALGYLPPAMLLITLIARSLPDMTLSTIIRTTLKMSDDGLAVINGRHQVVWHNSPFMRWLNDPPPATMIPRHVREMLRGSPLKPVLLRMLESGESAAETTVTRDGTDYTLQVTIQPLASVRGLSDTHLIVLHDVTALRMQMDMEERRRELLALSAIGADITSSLDLDQVVTRALQQILSVVQVDGVVVYLTDAQSPIRFELGGRYVRREGVLDTLPTSFEVEAGAVDSLINRVLQSRQSIVMEDTRQEPRYGHCLEQFGVRAGMVLPLISRSQLVGLLVLGYEEPQPFDALSTALLESVARQLAVAIDNARLHARERRQRRQAEVLREVANILATQSLDEALQALLEKLNELVDFERASVLIVAESGRLRIGAAVGFVHTDDGVPLPARRIVIAQYPHLQRLFETRRAQIVPDTTQDPQWQQGDYTYYSWMGVPLVYQGRVLGCLSITHGELGHFSAVDLKTATAFANQVVVAIENVQLFAEEQRRRIQAERLQQAAFDVVTSPDIETALQAALAHMAQVIDFDQAHVSMAYGEDQWMFRSVYPPSARLPVNRPITTTHYPLVRQILHDRTPVLIHDTRENPLWRKGRFTPQEIRSWIGVPLIVRGVGVGLLGIDGYRPEMFTEEHVQIAQMYAHQMAAAVESFRLLDEAQRQNRALRLLNLILAAGNESLTRENLLGSVLDELLPALNLEGGAIHVLVPARGELQLRAVRGLPEALIAQLEHVPVQYPLAGVRLPADEGWVFVGVPLMAHGQENGLLSVYHPEAEPLADDVRALLVNLGQQLGVVLQNATLFEDISRRARLSTDLGRLSLALSAQLDVQRVLDLLCHESLGIFDAQGAYIWLREGDELVGRVAHGPGADRFVGHRLSLEDADLLPVRVLREWRPCVLKPASNGRERLPDLAEMDGVESALAVPLIKANVPVGTLLLVNMTHSEAFAVDLADQVSTFGVQAALAIENANLFEEVRRRLDHLRLVNEVGRYSTAILSQTTLIEGVARKLYEILQYEAISLLAVVEGQVHLRAVFVGGVTVPRSRLSGCCRSAFVIAQKAVERAEPVRENQVWDETWAREGVVDVPCCSLGVPLIIADEVIGVLVVERRGHNSIRQEDLDVLEPLAAQLAISVSNARLYEKVREHTIELEARVAARTREIRRQHERTEAILRSVADAVIVFDLSGQVVLANPVARALFETYDLEYDLSSRISQMVAQVSQSDRALDEDTTEIITLGDVALQAKAAQVIEEDSVIGSVVVLRDITRLQELDRLKDRFISTVSHELRTPLANLKLYLSLLQTGHADRQKAYLEVMRRESDRLERLIDDLLQISRLHGQAKAERMRVRVPIDLDALIRRVIESNLAWAEREQNALSYDAGPDTLPSVLGDPDQIERALTNLVSNAIRYTPAGGPITVRSRLEGAGQSEPDWVIIEVEDSGIGIPQEDLPMIFERFYRGTNVSPTVPGTGLGLAILKEIVELHGGQVEVESQVGRGSVFCLRLPVEVV